MIDSLPDFYCAGTFEDAESLIKCFKHLDVHVVLMDIGLPGISGIECVEQLKEIRPDVHFLMCTNFEEDAKIYDALCAGATGYVLKNISMTDLAEAVTQISSGGSPMSPLVARKIVNSFSGKHKNTKLINALTIKEREVLNLLGKGHPYKIIADKMDIGIGTLRTHIMHIYEKLQVHSRADAVNKVFPKTLA